MIDKRIVIRTRKSIDGDFEAYVDSKASPCVRAFEIGAVSFANNALDAKKALKSHLERLGYTVIPASLSNN